MRKTKEARDHRSLFAMSIIFQHNIHSVIHNMDFSLSLYVPTLNIQLFQQAQRRHFVAVIHVIWDMEDLNISNFIRYRVLILQPCSFSLGILFELWTDQLWAHKYDQVHAALLKILRACKIIHLWQLMRCHFIKTPISQKVDQVKLEHEITFMIIYEQFLAIYLSTRRKWPCQDKPVASPLSISARDMHALCWK